MAAGGPPGKERWRVTTMARIEGQSRVHSRDECLRGWRPLPNGDMVRP